MTTAAPQGFFPEKVNNMGASNKLPFFPMDFVGRLRIDCTKGFTSPAGKRAYIAEFTVLTSNHPAVFVGGRYSWYQGIDPLMADTAYQACIAFLLAALGLDPSKDAAQIQKEFAPNQAAYLNASCNENPEQVFTFEEFDAQGNPTVVNRKGLVNIFRGREIMLQTSEKKKKAGKKMEIAEAREKGEVFTLHSFSPAPATPAVT